MERMELSIPVSSFLHIFHHRLCDQAVVLAEEALVWCISKTGVRQQQQQGLDKVGVASLGFITTSVRSIRKALPWPSVLCCAR